MKILGIETSTHACSVALMIDDEVVQEYQVAPQKHHDLVFEMMDNVITEAGVSLSQLDALTFGQGPGSFTGVRIAASVVSGISYAYTLPVVPVSTLAVIAQQGIESGYKSILVAIDARLNEIYCGSFIASGDMKLAQSYNDEKVISPDQYICSDDVHDWYLMGNGWEVYKNDIRLQPGVKVLGQNTEALPAASSLVRLASEYYQSGRYTDSLSIEPVYIRNQVTHRSTKA